MTPLQRILQSTSPYYLHPSDHPGLLICPVIFKGENYDEWVIAMRNSLCAKRKLGFIDESLTPPADSATTPPTIDDWYMVNSMLVSWVVQSIDLSLRSSITYFDNVKDLWDDHPDIELGQPCLSKKKERIEDS
ncbi:unnamed protein product [Rhodiola kirilowii]